MGSAVFFMKKLKIISGGQTGVDRAALDAAMVLGVEVGGWCPKGRKATDGVIENKYMLSETPSPLYQNRTVWNVRDSDGTLIIANAELTKGTAYTKQVCEERNKPFLILDPVKSVRYNVILFETFFNAHEIVVLNVAGPREDLAGKVYDRAFKLMIGLLSEM